jgi:hypothetical protein
MADTAEIDKAAWSSRQRLRSLGVVAALENLVHLRKASGVVEDGEERLLPVALLSMRTVALATVSFWPVPVRMPPEASALRKCA